GPGRGHLPACRAIQEMQAVVGFCEPEPALSFPVKDVRSMSVLAANFGDFPPPPEPGLTPADVIARAEAIAGGLVERQQETEDRTFYALDPHEAFPKAGFYRIMVPRRFGGYEFGVDTFLKVSIALTRGCPSTGWMYTLGHAHALAVATMFSEEAQSEVF